MPVQFVEGEVARELEAVISRQEEYLKAHYNLRMLVRVQACVRGWLVRRRFAVLSKKDRRMIVDFNQVWAKRTTSFPLSLYPPPFLCALLLLLSPLAPSNSFGTLELFGTLAYSLSLSLW
jgi:hypothetical protein